MKQKTINDVKGLAKSLGGSVIALEGEEEFSVQMEDDSVPFSFDQDGINDAMDILKELRRERKKENRP